MRRPLALLLTLVLVAGAAGSAHARRLAPAGPNATFVITGHGWGHGVGMSQYGAYGYAQHGFTYQKIVGHYFPGTQLGPAPVSKVRVLLASGQAKLKLVSPDDFTVRDGNGAAHDVAAGTYTLTPALKLKVDAAEKARAISGPLLFQPGSSPLVLGRGYRGAIQVDVEGGKLRAINDVGRTHGIGGRRLGWNGAVPRVRPGSVRHDFAVPQLGAVRVRRREARQDPACGRHGSRRPHGAELVGPRDDADGRHGHRRALVQCDGVAEAPRPALDVVQRRRDVLDRAGRRSDLRFGDSAHGRRAG